MKREIKFRAWDGKRIFEIRKLSIFKSWKGNKTKQKYSVTEDYNTCNPKAIMQFTGLKDKNGKEIFEGDIVSSGRFVGEVKYDIKQARFVCKKIKSEVENHPELLLWIIEWGSEVIGNKFENPELLKENVSI